MTWFFPCDPAMTRSSHDDATTIWNNIAKSTLNGDDLAKFLKHEDYGARKLVSRCYEIIGMGKTCNSIRELKTRWHTTTAKSHFN